MKLASLSRWLIAGALASAAVAVQSAEVKAVPHLMVGGISSNVNCVFDGANARTMEAWAIGADGRRVCEAITQGGSAMALCPLGTNRHQSAVTLRNKDTFAFVTTLAPPSQMQTTWGSASPMLSVPIPNSGTCPGGATLFVQSIGFDFDVSP